jgi:hypothetical protein
MNDHKSITVSFDKANSIFDNINLTLVSFISKIELWELQRHLWTQFSSRLSDECFDYLTLGRRFCDQNDGTLSPTAFLDFTTRLLARSSTASGTALQRPTEHPLFSKILRRSSQALIGGFEDLHEDEDLQAQVICNHLYPGYPKLSIFNQMLSMLEGFSSILSLALSLFSD